MIGHFQKKISSPPLLQQLPKIVDAQGLLLLPGMRSREGRSYGLFKRQSALGRSHLPYSLILSRRHADGRRISGGGDEASTTVVSGSRQQLKRMPHELAAHLLRAVRLPQLSCHF